MAEDLVKSRVLTRAELSDLLRAIEFFKRNPGGVYPWEGFESGMKIEQCEELVAYNFNVSFSEYDFWETAEGKIKEAIDIADDSTGGSNVPVDIEEKVKEMEAAVKRMEKKEPENESSYKRSIRAAIKARANLKPEVLDRVVDIVERNSDTSTATLESLIAEYVDSNTAKEVIGAIRDLPLEETATTEGTMVKEESLTESKSSYSRTYPVYPSSRDKSQGTSTSTSSSGAQTVTTHYTPGVGIEGVQSSSVEGQRKIQAMQQIQGRIEKSGGEIGVRDDPFRWAGAKFKHFVRRVSVKGEQESEAGSGEGHLRNEKRGIRRFTEGLFHRTVPIEQSEEVERETGSKAVYLRQQEAVRKQPQARGILHSAGDRVIGQIAGKGGELAVSKIAGAAAKGAAGKAAGGGLKILAGKAASFIITKLGLQALANTVAPVVGGIIAFIGEKLLRKAWEGFKKYFGWFLKGAAVVGGVIAAPLIGLGLKILGAINAAVAGIGGLTGLVSGALSGLSMGAVSAMGLGAGLGGGLFGATGLATIGGLAGTGLITTMTIMTIGNAFYVPTKIAPIAADVKPEPVTVVKTVVGEDTFATNTEAQKAVVKYDITLASGGKIQTANYMDTLTIINKNGVVKEIKRSVPGGIGNAQDTLSLSSLGLDLTDSVIINSVEVSGMVTTDKGSINFGPVSSSATITIGTAPATAFYCPVVGGTMACSSADGPINNSCRHCSGAYLSSADGAKACETWPGNGQAIDIRGTEGQTVYLPSIEGKVVNWTYVLEGGDLSYTYDGNQQRFRQFSGKTENGEVYTMQIHHLTSDAAGVSQGAVYPSGTPAGKLAKFDEGKSSPHAHIQIEQMDGGAGTWVAADKLICNPNAITKKL